MTAPERSTRLFCTLPGIYLVILPLAPVISFIHLRLQSAHIEEERQRAIASYGTDEEVYGDCTGMSWIIPIAFSCYCLLFALMTGIFLLLMRQFDQTWTKVVAIALGIIAVAPAVLYLLQVSARCYRNLLR